MIYSIVASPGLNPQSENHADQVSNDGLTDSDCTSKDHENLTQTQGSVQRYPDMITEDTRYTNQDSAIAGSKPQSDEQGTVNNLGLFNTETVYSESVTSTPLPPGAKEDIADFGAELFNAVRFCGADTDTLERISDMLPELLRTFALKVGYRAQMAMHRDISVFVHKHRR
jgi:hypothetical protein